MPLESTIEKYLVKRVEACGGVCAKTVRPGRRGWPDRTVVLWGQTFFVETKRPKKGVLSQQQKECHEEIRAAGGWVYTLYDQIDVDVFMGSMNNARLANAR